MTVTLAPGLADEIRRDLDAVKASLTTLVNDARGQWQPQTDALKSALDKLSAAVDNLVASPGAGGLSGVRAARAEVQDAARNLLTEVSRRCPSPSPSL